jgi:hypothetical protein
MIDCCAAFSQAVAAAQSMAGVSQSGGSFFGGTATGASSQDVAITFAPETKEEKVECDCSWVIGNRGQCGDSKQGDGSPCGIKCCEDPADLVKDTLSGFESGIKEKLGGLFGGPNPAIKVYVGPSSR